MIDLDDPFRTLACAARLRDWGAVDVILEDQRAKGSLSIRRGFNDARKALGQEPRLTPVHDPQAVTILDLPSREGVEIVGKLGDTHKWRKRNAA